MTGNEPVTTQDRDGNSTPEQDVSAMQERELRAAQSAEGTDTEPEPAVAITPAVGPLPPLLVRLRPRRQPDR